MPTHLIPYCEVDPNYRNTDYDFEKGSELQDLIIFGIQPTSNAIQWGSMLSFLSDLGSLHMHPFQMPSQAQKNEPSQGRKPIELPATLVTR